MNIKILISITSLGLLQAQAQSAPSDFLQTVGKALTTAMLRCPERVWPEYDWKNYSVLMKTENSVPMVWRGQTGETKALSPKEIPASAFKSTYSFLKFENKEAVYVDLSKVSVKAYQDLIFHEGFHHQGQKLWTRNQPGGRRGTAYPATHLPRAYRLMLFDRLKEYFLSGGQASEKIHQAAFWWNQWKANYPDEVLNSVDNTEGSANYVNIIATQIAAQGCSASEQSLAVGVVSEIGTTKGQDLDGEAYTLGALAGYTLRFIRQDHDWQKKLQLGTDILEILLSKVSPQDDVIPEKLLNELKTNIQKENLKVAQLIDVDLRLLGNPTSLRIFPKATGSKGSYSTHGFYLPVSQPNLTLIPLVQDFKIGNLTASKGKVMFADTDIPCEGGARYGFVVASQNIQIQKGILLANSDGVTTQMSGTLIKNKKGITCFCEN